MEREKFVKLVEEALDAVPTKFRKRIHNVAVLVENVPPEQPPRSNSRNAGIIDSEDAENLVLGVFEGVPTTKKSAFDLSAGPDRIVNRFGMMPTSVVGFPFNRNVRPRIVGSRLHRRCHIL